MQTVKKWMCGMVVLWLVVMAAVMIGGCGGVAQSLDQLSSVRDQAVVIQEDLNDQLDELALMRESIPDQSPQSDAIDALMAQVGAKLAVVDAAVLHANQVFETVNNPSDPLSIAAQAISPWVPAPIQGPLVLGAALVGTLIRLRSVNNGARSIVESINHVLKKDDSFKAVFEANADTIRTIQTPAARKIVDKWSK